VLAPDSLTDLLDQLVTLVQASRCDQFFPFP
jgi:hypothetical protein